MMAAAGTGSKGSSASLDQESPKLYIGQAAIYKPSWPGWWGAGGLGSGFLGLCVASCPVHGV